MKHSILTLILALIVLPAASLADVEVKPQDRETVLAKAQDYIVTKEDLLRYVILRVPEERRYVYLSTPEHVRQAIQNILMIRILAERGKEAGVSVDADQLEWEKEFTKANLYAQGYQDIEIQKAQGNIAWEKRAKEIYLAEGERFLGKPKVDAAHILIKVGDERSSEAALALIANIKAQLDKGADFNELAKEYSEDPSVEYNDGELGEFTRDKMVKEFADAAFALQEEGEISEPVKSRFGYHLIKLNKRISPVKREFEAVRPNIIKSLKAKAKKETVDAILVELRSSLGLELDQEAISAVNDEYDLLK